MEHGEAVVSLFFRRLDIDNSPVYMGTSREDGSDLWSPYLWLYTCDDAGCSRCVLQR